MPHEFVRGHIVKSNGADNMGADITSGMIPISGASGIGIEVKVDNTVLGTKTAVGIYQIQVSNSGINWIPVVLSGGSTDVAVAAATDNKDFINLEGLNANFMRFFYDRTGGNGLIDVYVHVRRG